MIGDRNFISVAQIHRNISKYIYNTKLQHLFRW